MKFFKYQGAGNDFIIIDNRRGDVPEKEKSLLAKAVCDRHFGVGGDGLILVESSERADARMRIFNPDGSEAEMCGNGIRCMGKFLHERGAKKDNLLIETVGGVRELELTVEGGNVTQLEVDMDVPMDVSLNRNLQVDDRLWDYSYVDMGVPHTVIFVDDLETFDLEGLAPGIRYNPVFPRGTNVNLVQQLGGRVFKIRTYERGVERETLACGTGISASAVVAVFLGYAGEEEELEFRARGGTLHVTIKREDSGIRVFMKGPAEFVFEGNVTFK
jgi:diaminopimelate epimerase